jgi:hypothetical protein
MSFAGGRSAGGTKVAGFELDLESQRWSIQPCHRVSNGIKLDCQM